MPLSEDEQRILHEIEQQFYANDPHLAGEIGNHSVYAHCLRQMKWAGVMFAVGVQFFLMGLLAEMQVRTYHESQAKAIYAVRERVGFSEQ